MTTSLDADTSEMPLGIAVRACRSLFVNAAIFSALLNLLYLAPTIYMIQLYDRVLPTRGGTTLVMLTVVLIGSVATISLLDMTRMRLLGAAGARLDNMLAGPIVDALMRVASTPNSGRNTATLREFDTLRQTLTGIGLLAVLDAPWSPIYILLCFFLHWVLGVEAVVGCIILGILSWLAERASKNAVMRASQVSQLNFMSIDNSLAHADVLGALGMRDVMTRRHLRERATATRLTGKSTYDAALYTAWIKGLRLLLQSLALGTGVWLAIEQQISGGAIFAASILVARVLGPIVTITEAWKGIIRAREAYASLEKLFAQRGVIAQPTTLPAPAGLITVEKLRVDAPGGDQPLLQDVSFGIAGGEMLGIVGPSGAGKSTLIKALAHVLPAASGTVRIDGAALDDWPEWQRSTMIGYVPQEPALFRGTIKENIARFQTENGPSADVDAEVLRVAQLCGAHDFILRLPNAYDSPLGWGGVGLSMGQAQRITLARALYGRPRILILDEPNASLDVDGEHALIEALAALKAQGVTIIVAAHRASVLQNADKLAVIRDGRLAMFGPRGAVIERLAGTRPPEDTPPPGRVEAVQA